MSLTIIFLVVTLTLFDLNRLRAMPQEAYEGGSITAQQALAMQANAQVLSGGRIRL